jgi:hypothetical protein
MYHRMGFVYALAWVLYFNITLLLGIEVAKATPTDTDASLWVPIHLDVPLTKKWTFETEPQLRWNEGYSHAGQQQWRNGLSYKVNKHLTLTAGHMVTSRQLNNQPLFNDDTQYENRLYQDVEIKHPLSKGWEMDHRIRLEQRLFKNVEDPLWYLRYRIGFSHPLGKFKHTQYVQTHELLNHLNSVGPVPSGLVQQRHFVGVSHTFNKAVNMDAGYMAVLSDQFGQPKNSLNHVLFVQLNLRPTPAWEVEEQSVREAQPKPLPTLNSTAVETQMPQAEAGVTE